MRVAVLNTFTIMLQDYDILPRDMRAYLRNYGRHFNQKACDFAVSLMQGRDGNKIKPIDKDKVDAMLKSYEIKLEHAQGYDHVYVANMAKADFYGSSITEEDKLALYVKDVIDDFDGSASMVFNRWLADMDTKGIGIDWEELL